MMKRLLISAALLAALCGTAFAQNSQTQGQSFRGVLQFTPVGGYASSDTTGVIARMSSTGGLSIYDESRDRDKVTLFENVVTGTNLAQGAADSNFFAIDVHAYRYLKLLIKITPRTGANTVTRVALQFREQKNNQPASDSSGTFAEYVYQSGPQVAQHDSLVFGVVAGQARLNSYPYADSSVAGHILAGSASTPWSGEYMVVINGARSASTTGSNTDFHWPNGISIPMDSFYGRPARFQYLTIRLRNLGPGAGSTPAIDYNIDVLGFAQ
jgi:hypothetical protein